MRQSIMSHQRTTKRNLLVFEDQPQMSDSEEQQDADAIQYRPPSITSSDLQHLCDLQQFGEEERDYVAFQRAWKRELYGSEEEESLQDRKDREWPQEQQEYCEYEDSNSRRSERSRRRFAAEQFDYNKSRGRSRYKKTRSTRDEEAWKIAEAKEIKQFKSKTVINFIDSQALKSQTVKTIQGVQTYFPYQPYDLQIKYMDRVMEAVKSGQNAILQSPTGTGKSLCLLSAVLSWIHSQKVQGRHRKVIYLSRTHSQLTQISTELKKTCFRPTMAHVASRDLLCVKPEIQSLKGREKVQACSKGVKLALKDKQGHINWSKMPRQEKEETLKAMCSVYKQKPESVQIGKLNYSNKIIQMDDFRQQGRQFNFCPYYYPFHMDQYCDLFLMPYNYILDAEILDRFDAMIANSVIIFDQAHNVPEASCEGRSSELFLANQKGAENQIQMLLFSKKESLVLIRRSFPKQIQDIQHFLEDLRSTTIDFLQAVPFLDAPKPAEKLYKGEDEHERIKVFDEESIELALYEIFMGKIMDENMREIFQKRSDYFNKCMREMINKIGEIESTALELIEQLKEAKQGIFHNVQKVCGFWSRIGKLLGPSLQKQAFAEKELNHFRLVVKVQLQTEHRGFDDKMRINSYSLQMRCLVPWLTFREITAKEPRCIIFTSGTLSPLDSYESELAIEAPIKLVNKHVISDKQVTLNIVKQNLQGHSFDFRFKNLSENSLGIYRELTETLLEISRRVPSGMLVVCPNFKTLRELKYHVNMRENLKRMGQVKAQIFEERGGERYIQEFKEKSQKGAILYCVCRGRASEGIDFPDHHCRAVVFVGIPFPNIGDPILVEKKEHFWKLEKMRQKEGSDIPTITWEKWYFNGTMRAINQSLGRLIRHSKDYGMLFLLDERYAETRFQRALPQWTQMSINVWQLLTPERIEAIEQFYDYNRSAFAGPLEKKAVIRQQQAREEEQEKTVVKPNRIFNNQARISVNQARISTNQAIAKIASFMPKNGKITSYFPIFPKTKKKS